MRGTRTLRLSRLSERQQDGRSLLVSGLDIQAHYSLPIASDWKLDIAANYNRLFKQQQTPFPGGPVQNELGQAACFTCGRLGSGFKDRIVGNFTLGSDNFKFNYRVDYLGPLWDSLPSSTNLNPTRIPAYWYHNIQGKFVVGDDRKMELYVGVNNLFDKQPPVFGDTNPVTWLGTQTIANTYDVYGRMIYAGATFKF